MNSRAKGQRGERMWRDQLREAGFTGARRGQQYAGSPDSPDVICPELPTIHFEVKFVENLNLHKAMEQACRDCSEDQIPVVAHKKSRTPWLITMKAEDWLNLIKETDLPQ